MVIRRRLFIVALSTVAALAVMDFVFAVPVVHFTYEAGVCPYVPDVTLNGFKSLSSFAFGYGGFELNSSTGSGWHYFFGGNLPPGLIILGVSAEGIC